MSSNADADRPLLMIPGPIEISPGVLKACEIPPPSHVSAGLIADFGAALGLLRRVFLAGPDAHPFIIAGSGTLAMEMAATNLLDPGDRALVVNSGHFSDRMEEMLRRRGVRVESVRAGVGDAPSVEAVEEALSRHRPKVLFATHVDTSTGVRIDPEPLCRLCQDHGALSVFDGVCATAGEPFFMERWGADVYLTASQKAVGLPAGLALLVASPRALEARSALSSLPPLVLDWQSWLPIMTAYQEGRPSYFATPATTLIPALRVSLEELLAEGPEPEDAMRSVFSRHARTGRAMRAAWAALGLELVPLREELAANTLSAVRLPEGVGPDLPRRVLSHGVSIAGGLHPAIRDRYFRVGHMGYTTRRPDWLEKTVQAVGNALFEAGHPCDVEAAIAALSQSLQEKGR